MEETNGLLEALPVLHMAGPHVGLEWPRVLIVITQSSTMLALSNTSQNAIICVFDDHCVCE